MDKELIKHMLDACIEEQHKLTKWESDFIESISDQFEIKNWLSERQEEILERIYSEKTS